MEKEPMHESVNEQLKQEILAMVKEDQEMRRAPGWDSEIDKQHTKRMKEIIKHHGWPEESLVGEEAAMGAWLLAQHADHDVEFQKQALELLKAAVEKGEARKINEAYLVDRVKVNSGEPQVFGTQFYEDAEGKFGSRPIEGLENLETRRKEVGLEPFSEYEKSMKEEYETFKEERKKKNE